MKNIFKKDKVQVEFNGAKVLVSPRLAKEMVKEEKKNQHEAELAAMSPEERKAHNIKNGLKVGGALAAAGFTAWKVGELVFGNKKPKETGEDTTVMNDPELQERTEMESSENSDTENIPE